MSEGAACPPVNSGRSRKGVLPRVATKVVKSGAPEGLLFENPGLAHRLERAIASPLFYAARYVCRPDLGRLYLRCCPVLRCLLAKMLATPLPAF